MKHFRKIGTLDPAPVLAALERLPDAFAAGAWRRKTKLTPHPDSDTLEIVGPPSHGPRQLLNSLELVETGAAQIPAFHDAVIAIGEMVRHQTARAMIVSLRPGGTVRSHRDEGAYADATERYHFAIDTNQGAIMVADSESAFFGTGEVWWIDKHVVHCAANLGATPRVHMIVDVWRQAAC